jgi:hypothetical protein
MSNSGMGAIRPSTIFVSSSTTISHSCEAAFLGGKSGFAFREGETGKNVQ